MKIKNIKISCTILIMLFVSCIAFGQNEADKSEKAKDKRWNIHKKEFGLDFKSLNRNLDLNSIGTNLIYKKHIGEKKFISVNEKKALRIQFGGFADYAVNQQDSLGTFAGWANLNYQERQRLNLNALVGIEWQKQIKRIQLYYGLDTGIRYNKFTNPFLVSRLLSTGEIIGYVTEDGSGISVPLYGFVGVKYFIHPRVSVSIEGSMMVGVTWLKYFQIYYDNQLNEEQISSEAKRTEINFNTDYVRFINVGFHF